MFTQVTAALQPCLYLAGLAAFLNNLMNTYVLCVRLPLGLGMTPSFDVSRVADIQPLCQTTIVDGAV